MAFDRVSTCTTKAGPLSVTITEADPRGGGRGGHAPSPQKFRPCFFLLHGQKFQPCFFAAWHACSARLTFDQRTVYVLSTARVSRSVSSQVHAICMTAGR